jgi:hypothetical protein
MSIYIVSSNLNISSPLRFGVTFKLLDPKSFNTKPVIAALAISFEPGPFFHMPQSTHNSLSSTFLPCIVEEFVANITTISQPIE